MFSLKDKKGFLSFLYMTFKKESYSLNDFEINVECKLGYFINMVFNEGDEGILLHLFHIWIF